MSTRGESKFNHWSLNDFVENYLIVNTKYSIVMQLCLNIIMSVVYIWSQNGVASNCCEQTLLSEPIWVSIMLIVFKSDEL